MGSVPGNAGAIILIGSPGDQTTCDYLVKRSCKTTTIKPHSGTSSLAKTPVAGWLVAARATTEEGRDAQHE
jgi:hypothetical protein